MNTKYQCKSIKPYLGLYISWNLMPFLYPITRKWKEVELRIYIYKEEVTKDKCIPLRIEDDNVPPKFVVLIQNATLKNHNLYKNGLENIKL